MLIFHFSFQDPHWYLTSLIDQFPGCSQCFLFQDTVIDHPVGKCHLKLSSHILSPTIAATWQFSCFNKPKHTAKLGCWSNLWSTADKGQPNPTQLPAPTMHPQWGKHCSPRGVSVQKVTCLSLFSCPGVSPWPLNGTTQRPAPVI